MSNGACISAEPSPFVIPAKAAIHCLSAYHEAVFHASAMFPQAAMTVEGQTRNCAGRLFCPHCGSSVLSRTSALAVAMTRFAAHPDGAAAQVPAPTQCDHPTY